MFIMLNLHQRLKRKLTKSEFLRWIFCASNLFYIFIVLSLQAAKCFESCREPGPSHSGGIQSYASVTRAGKHPKLEFLIENAVLKPNETVFQAVRQVRSRVLNLS